MNKVMNLFSAYTLDKFIKAWKWNALDVMKQ